MLEYFYVSLSVVYKSVADRLVREGLTKQMFVVVAELLDKTVKISKGWYTKDYYPSSTKRRVSREQLAKEN